MYKYRITLESTTLSQTSQGSTTQFQVQNHDDLSKIVEAVRSKGILDADKSAALAVSLKLFSEIVLEKRSDPLFVPLWEPIRSFTKRSRHSGRLQNKTKISQRIVPKVRYRARRKYGCTGPPFFGDQGNAEHESFMCLTTLLSSNFTEAFEVSATKAASIDVRASEITGINTTPGTGTAS